MVPSFQKKARKKFVSQNLVLFLLNSNPDSPLRKSYWNTYHCQEIMVVGSEKITTKYCKNRFCPACCSIYTAKAIKGYSSSLAKFNNPYFVTLTLPTVQRDALPDRITFMIKMFRLILGSKLGRKLKVKGLRSLECTVRPNDRFHPHFHVVCDTEESADFLIEAWLKRNSDANSLAQDMRVCDDRSMFELFKYFTKTTVCKDGKYVLNDLVQLDWIYRCIKGRRIFQPFGGIKFVKENIDDIESQLVDVSNLSSQYVWIQHDWADYLGNFLTGYVPSDQLYSLFKV